jgi:hypothetical protein
MSLLWQLRHTAVHNVCVITKSDAVKLRVLAKARVDAPRMLVPTTADLHWLKTYLDDVAEDCNRRLGERLAELLTTLHAEMPILIPPQPTADQVAAIFRLPLVVAGATGVVPTD